MRIQNGPVWFDVAAELLDEILIEASRSASETDRARFLREREAVASIETVDIREDTFRSFDVEWVDRFGVLEPLQGLLSDWKPRGWVLRRVKSRQEERARLSHDSGESVVHLAVQPKTMLSRAGLERLLTAELLSADLWSVAQLH